MPTLNWIGKEAVVKHHKEVPFRLLEPVPVLSCGPADAGNLIVQGDNVNSPEIRKWLGEVVGKEGETLDRHDRWLSMMYPRLVLLKQFLRDDGAIFISIDDNKVATLRLLMDEVFGAANFVACNVRQKRYSRENHSAILAIEYKGADRWTAAKDDRLIGGLWANISEGRCRFAMVKDKRWKWIEPLLQ